MRIWTDQRFRKFCTHLENIAVIAKPYPHLAQPPLDGQAFESPTHLCMYVMRPEFKSQICSSQAV